MANLLTILKRELKGGNPSTAYCSIDYVHDEFILTGMALIFEAPVIFWRGVHTLFQLHGSLGSSSLALS